MKGSINLKQRKYKITIMYTSSSNFLCLKASSKRRNLEVKSNFDLQTHLNQWHTTAIEGPCCGVLDGWAMTVLSLCGFLKCLEHGSYVCLRRLKLLEHRIVLSFFAINQKEDSESTISEIYEKMNDFFYFSWMLIKILYKLISAANKFFSRKHL